MKPSLPLIRVSTVLLAVVGFWWTTPAKAQLPRPTNLHATLLSNGSVYLTWTDSAQGEDGYNVYRQKLNPGPYVVVNHGTTPDQNSYVDSSTLVRGATYWYYVAAYKGNVVGKKSNKVQIKIGTPPAADVVVNTLADHDDGTCSATDCTLREAIKYVPATGKVAFASGLNGTIQLDPNLGELAIGKGLTVQGPGADLITVSGNNAVRVFSVGSATVTLRGLTIANGSSGGGSGILLSAGTLTVSECVLTANIANFEGDLIGDGGAVFNSGDLTLTNSTVSDNNAFIGGAISNNGTLMISSSTLSVNAASRDGGCIYNHARGRVVVNNSTFFGNTTLLVGGAIINYGTLMLNNSTLSGNSVTGINSSGGGISNHDGGTAVVRNSTISGNSCASGLGGGIFSGSNNTLVVTNLTVSNSTVSGNGAIYGGGISNTLGTVTVSNSTLSGNVAFYGGGGIFNDRATMAVSNSTLVGNTATNDSGGIFGAGGGISMSGYGGTLDLNNSIVAANSADAAGPDIFGTVSSGDYNLVQNTDGATLPGNHNITGQSPNVGPLQNNSGPTKTHALLSGSPAINAGSNALVPPDYSDQDGDGNTTEPVPYDQRGRNTAPGELGFNRITGTAVDIGAFELQSDPVIGP